MLTAKCHCEKYHCNHKLQDRFQLALSFVLTSKDYCITAQSSCWQYLQYKENLEMRTRYADQPEKFMESELDLDEEVKKLMAIAGSPELYPDFVRTNTVETLLTLLTHQNTDIVADVIGVFEDLTDADVIEDSVSAVNLHGMCNGWIYVSTSLIADIAAGPGWIFLLFKMHCGDAQCILVPYAVNPFTPNALISRKTALVWDLSLLRVTAVGMQRAS